MKKLVGRLPIPRFKKIAHNKLISLTIGFLLFLTIIGLIWGSQRQHRRLSDFSNRPWPTPAPQESSLVYIHFDPAKNTSSIVRGPDSETNSLKGPNNKESISSEIIQAGCGAGQLIPEQKGRWVAAQVDCGSGGYVQLIDTETGEARPLNPSSNGVNSFLGWSPNGYEAAIIDDVTGNSQVLVVNIENGETKQLPISGNTYNLMFSPDNRLIYTFTNGLGYGSELWMANADGSDAMRIIADPTHIIAFPHWSPIGEKIAYIRMPDSTIPFTVGELWIIDNDGQNPSMLYEADAGHGYEPVWSLDGSKIAFVVRENKDDTAADRIAERLASNIYVVDIETRTVSNITQFTSALTENPIWSPDGEFVAFSTSAGGEGMDVWVYSFSDNSINQVTHGANVRYPSWLPYGP